MKYLLLIIVMTFTGCSFGHVKKHSDHDKQIASLRTSLARNDDPSWEIMRAQYLQGYILGNGCVDTIAAMTPTGDSVRIIIWDKGFKFDRYYHCKTDECAQMREMWAAKFRIDTIWVDSDSAEAWYQWTGDTLNPPVVIRRTPK